MKKVVSQSEVCHLWANKLQEEARTSNNTLFFEGDTIYSYGNHFPIATHYNNLVLFTYDKYGNTTEKHKSKVSRACNNKTQVLCYDPKRASQGLHQENLQSFINRIKAFIDKLANCRKPELYINPANYWYDNLNKYCELFELEIPEEAKDLIAVTNTEEYKTYLANLDELNKKREEDRVKRLETRLLEELPLWRTFEKRNLNVRIDRDYLRFNKDKQRVETSQNVEIPLELAKRLWQKIVNNELVIDDYILSYKVLLVTEEYFQVGCHKIYYDECELIAKELKL